MRDRECEADRSLRKVNGLVRSTKETQQIAGYDKPSCFSVCHAFIGLQVAEYFAFLQMYCEIVFV